jgi:hypothetical protein
MFNQNCSTLTLIFIKSYFQIHIVCEQVHPCAKKNLPTQCQDHSQLPSLEHVKGNFLSRPNTSKVINNLILLQTINSPTVHHIKIQIFPIIFNPGQTKFKLSLIPITHPPASDRLDVLPLSPPYLVSSHAVKSGWYGSYLEYWMLYKKRWYFYTQLIYNSTSVCRRVVRM